MARKGVKGKAAKKATTETFNNNNGIDNDENGDIVEEVESGPVNSRRGKKAKAEIIDTETRVVSEKSDAETTKVIEKTDAETRIIEKNDCNIKEVISNKRKAKDDSAEEIAASSKQTKLGKIETNAKKDSSENEVISTNNTTEKDDIKNPVPVKRGRKKNVDASNEVAASKELDLKTEESDFVVPKKGRKKPADKINLAGEDNVDEVLSSVVHSEKNQNSDPKEETISKRGRKKIEKNLDGKSEKKNDRNKMVAKDISDVKKSDKKETDIKVPEAPTVRGKLKKKNELLNDEEVDAQVPEKIVKKVPRKGKRALDEPSPLVENIKDCYVALHRDENVEKLSDENKSSPKKVKSQSNIAMKSNEKNKNLKGKKNKVEDGEGSSKPSKVPKKDAKPSEKANIAKTPDMKALNFDCKATTSNGKPWNIKISSWNVNGIRAWIEKDGLSYIHHENPDIIALQETKCSDDKLPDDIKNVENYKTYWLSGDKDGYSGIGLLTKEIPIEVKYGIGMEQHDAEGRVITAEYESFFLVAAYVPNAGRGLVRLEYRTQWDKDFCMYLKKLDEKKPVILCGDLNVAHEEIDLANPKSNKKTAGFTKEEREGFSSLLKEGFIDTFRHLYPDTKSAYTFWTYMMNARAKNAGWRLDYFIISERFVDNLCDSTIRKDVYGSDHCPITLFLAV